MFLWQCNCEKVSRKIILSEHTWFGPGRNTRVGYQTVQPKGPQIQRSHIEGVIKNRPFAGKPKCDKIMKISSVIQDVIYLSIRHESSIFCAKIQNFCGQKMI